MGMLYAFLLDELRVAIISKRRGKISKGVHLFQGNVSIGFEKNPQLCVP